MVHHTHKHYKQARQYFDLLTYIHELKKVGISQEVAEVQGEALNKISEQVAEQSHYLLTKADQQETNARIVQIQANVKEIKHELVYTRQELTARIGSASQRADARIDALDKKFDARIDSLDQKLTAHIGSVEQRLDALDQKLTARIESLEQKLSNALRVGLSKCTNSLHLWMFSMMSVMLGVMARGFHWI